MYNVQSTNSTKPYPTDSVNNSLITKEKLQQTISKINGSICLQELRTIVEEILSDTSHENKEKNMKEVINFMKSNNCSDYVIDDLYLNNILNGTINQLDGCIDLVKLNKVIKELDHWDSLEERLQATLTVSNFLRKNGCDDDKEPKSDYETKLYDKYRYFRIIISDLDNMRIDNLINAAVEKLISGLDDEHSEEPPTKKQCISTSRTINYNLRQNNLFHNFYNSVGTDQYRTFVSTQWTSTLLEKELKDWYQSTTDKDESQKIIYQLLKAYHFPSSGPSPKLTIGNEFGGIISLPEKVLTTCLPLMRIKKLTIMASFSIPINAEPAWFSIDSLRMGGYFGFHGANNYGIPSSFFKNMPQLKSLYLCLDGAFIIENLPNLSYLYHLEHLTIEIGNESRSMDENQEPALPKDVFKFFPKLQSLTFIGFPMFELTSEDLSTLPNIRNLHKLSFYDTFMSTIENGMFANLRLKSLTITGSLGDALFEDPEIFSGLDSLTKLHIDSDEWGENSNQLTSLIDPDEADVARAQQSNNALKEFIISNPQININESLFRRIQNILKSSVPVMPPEEFVLE